MAFAFEFWLAIPVGFCQGGVNLNITCGDLIEMYD